MVDENDLLNASLDAAFPSDDATQTTIPSAWQGVSTEAPTTPIKQEPLQYSGFRPKPFFQVVNEILSPKIPINQNTQVNYQQINAPTDDPYQQDEDALKSRRQQGTTPFQEEFINCHSFAQTALQLVTTDTGDMVATGGHFAQTQVITNIVTDISALLAPGQLVFQNGILFGAIVSFDATTITLDTASGGWGVGQLFQVYNPGNASSQISSGMLRYLIDFFGPTWNFFDSGNGPIIPWSTVAVSLSANFLKIDYLPAQVTVPSVPTIQDSLNARIDDDCGPFGPGGATAPLDGRGVDYISNRQVFIQFDRQDAPILIAKPGRVFKTQGFDTVYVTFSGDNGRIRVTTGYADAEIKDNDVSTLKLQNLHIWPGNEVLNDPYLHPVPNSWMPGKFNINADAGGINTTSGFQGVFEIGATQQNRTIPIIQNRFLPSYEGSNNGSLHQNSANGCVVGWITGINIGTIATAGPATINYSLCIGDPFDSGREYSRRPIWSMSDTAQTGASARADSIRSYQFNTPLRFVLNGKEFPNRQFSFGNPNAFYESYGDSLFLMVNPSGGYVADVYVSVQFYTIGNVFKFPTMIQQNRGDFSAASTVVSNVNIDPFKIDSYQHRDGLPDTDGNWHLVTNGALLGSIVSFTHNSYTLSSPVPGFLAGLQQDFAIIDRTYLTYAGQTLNVNPYPLDRVNCQTIGGSFRFLDT